MKYNINRNFKAGGYVMSSPDISEFPVPVREFAMYKRSIQGCSQKTVDEYLLDLRMFTRFLVFRERGEKFTDEKAEKLDIKEIDLDF